MEDLVNAIKAIKVDRTQTAREIVEELGAVIHLAATCPTDLDLNLAAAEDAKAQNSGSSWSPVEENAGDLKIENGGEDETVNGIEEGDDEEQREEKGCRLFGS